ncbi:MAG: hypothetical protein ACOC5F_01110 [Candidatus Aminicenantaceae bacterium]
MGNIDKKSRAQYRTKVEEKFPDKIKFGKSKYIKKLSMRYGENPGYPAAFYSEKDASGPNLANIEVLKEGKKGLSYINIGDMDLGQRLVIKLNKIYEGKNICALIKHEIPSGVAMGEDSLETFNKAWGCDPLSNFGSVNVFNYEIDKSVAELIVESKRNVEVVFAPSYHNEAMDILSARKPLRVVRMGADIHKESVDNGLEFKRVAGGILLQKRFDSKITSPDDVEVVSDKKPSPNEMNALIFNWIVACYTRSNAIVIGKEDKVHGIGSGQRSRIDATENAIKFSKRGYGTEDCVMASDAFMPFPDVVEMASQNKIKAIIFPLGSIRDKEVIQRANELNIAMVVTRKPKETSCERSFLHR